MSGYQRYENETDEELILRVCSDKDKIGTWQDVCQILNDLTGNDYNESAYRKKFQTFQRMLEANKSKFVDNDEQLQELENKLAEIRKERMKLQTANLERTRLERSEARQEMYYEYIGSVCDTLPLPQFKPLKLGDSSINYVATIADIHYGATFKSANNEYNPEITKERLNLFLAHLMEFVEEKNLNHINVVCLGDALQGLIRLNDLKINDSSVVKATVDISKLLASFLNELSTVCNVTYYHVPTANHTQIRPLGTKASEIADEDLEYIIGHYIETLCSMNERITVKLADEGSQYIMLDVPGNIIIAGHGHTIKNVNSALRDLSMLYGKWIDYLLLGHFHGEKQFSVNESTYNDCEVIIAPSLVGSDPYSDSIMKGSKSACKIYGFNELYGLTEQYKFILN